MHILQFGYRNLMKAVKLAQLVSNQSLRELGTLSLFRPARDTVACWFYVSHGLRRTTTCIECIYDISDYAVRLYVRLICKSLGSLQLSLKLSLELSLTLKSLLPARKSSS